MRQICILLFVALSVLLCSCRSSPKQTVIPAFYCWQTTFSLSAAQRNYLEETACKKLYVKIADIGLEPGSGAIVPFSQLQVTDSSNLSGFQVVQVVFITNEVFRNIDPEKTTDLAEKIAGLQARLGLPAMQEFQVDCDWTATTRDAFFNFLTILRTKLPPGTILSATIRLHQYKFPQQSGVPPVDRGMLMCYNTGDIDDSATPNSIFDPKDVEKYIVGAPEQYALPLDLALPAFSWILVYREDELWKIIPGQHSQIPTGLLEKGTFLSGHYLRPGDMIRRETISAEMLKNAARLCAGTDLADDATLAFFHLDAATPRYYPAQLIDSVCKIADSIRSKK